MNPRFLFVVAMLIFPAQAIAAQDETPETVFAAMKQAATNANWTKLLTHMTPETQKKLVQQTISGAGVFTKQTYPVEPAGLDAAREQIKKVLSNHGLDKIETPDPQDMTKAVPSATTLKQRQEQQRRYAEAVLKAVENRDELLADITKAMIKSPMPGGGVTLFRLGKITDVKISEAVASATIEVDLSPATQQDGPLVSFVMPPTPIKFKLIDDQWKYDGIDRKKAAELMADQGFGGHHSPLKNESPEKLPAKPAKDVASAGSMELIATWIPFAKGSTYGFAEKWPELTRLKPEHESKSYDYALFGSLLPPNNADVGAVWKLNSSLLLPLLQQFHKGASLELHHHSATGAYASLVGASNQYYKILFRLHGEIKLPDGSFYTPSQFEGSLLWNIAAKKPEYFHLSVPPENTNVDVNRLIPARTVNGQMGRPSMSVDIGFTPKMELVGGKKIKPVNWTKTIPLKDARISLSRRFYKFAEVNWLPFEEAVAKSRATKKPLHIVALFGTLKDESC